MKRDAVLTERKKAASEGSPDPLCRIEIQVSRRIFLVLTVCLILPYLIAAGYYVGRSKWGAKLAPTKEAKAADPMATPVGTQCKPGPWGDLRYLKIFIESPEEYLSVRAFEETDPRWFFGGYTREKVAALFDQIGLTAGQKDQLLKAQWEVTPTGVYLKPSDETVVSLAANSRQQLYSVLTQFPQNSSQQDVFDFPPDRFNEFFEKSKVSDKTIALVKQLCYPHGRLLFFADMPLVLRGLKTYEEKQRLAKAVSRRPTILLRLRVGPETDINSLLRYWAKAGQEKDLRPIVESLSKLPEGAWISLMNLLPPLPSSRLYTFAFPSIKPLEHDNCHWSSFNFFKDPPDDHFSDMAFVKQKLDSDYYPVFTDPRYGDLVFLTKANGDIIHSSVFMADDIVYTKNGGHYLSPWMLMQIPDMVDAFSAMLPANETLKVVYYRNKYY
jgi:hypothetical protein